MHLTFDVELYMPLRDDEAFVREQGRAWADVLDVLDAREVRSTFFTTGEFVQRYPDLFDRMVRAGHEIASHTMTHRPFGGLPGSEIEWEVAESRRFLRKASGQEVVGFRAPLGQAPDDLARVLAASGYRYDSSVAATHVPGRFRGLGSPRRPYRPSASNLRREGPDAGVVELPVSVSPGVPLPYGGFFLSVLAPLAWRTERRRAPPRVLFLHPYDFMDMRGRRGAYAWDRLKRTRANWRLLRRYAEWARGTDRRLATALEEVERRGPAAS